MFSRTPPPPRARNERRRSLGVIFFVAVVVYLILTALGTLWTDYLWFDSIGFESVWRKRWTVGLGLGAAGIGVALAVLWLTLYLAEKFGPRFFPRDLQEEEELVARYRHISQGRGGRLRFLVAGVLAVLVGSGVSGWRDDLFLFISPQDFPLSDPIFDLNVGFYVFRFPFIDNALRWSFNLLLTATVLAALAHYLNGGIRIRRGTGPTFTSNAKVHLSVMLAVMALVRAAIYRMDALALLYSNRQAPSFFGPGYTDAMARLPALRLLMAIAVVAAILFIVNIWRRGWTLTLVSVGGWILVSVAALLIYPAIIDRLQVQPNQLNLESEYIAHNIEFTRAAYGLDGVEIRTFPASRQLTADDIEANRLTVDNLRLWDATVLPRTYQNLQAIRPYYSLEQVDTDRYLIDGTPTQMMISIREFDEDNLERTDWQNTRLLYTHGIGAVVSQANRVVDGQPDFLVGDLPPEASHESLALTQPRVYFGETYQPGSPVIVKTGDSPQEVDMPEGGSIQSYEYSGDAGVGVGSLMRRIAFAFRYRDLNLLISSQVNADSRVLVQRNIRAIAADVAPFLEVDSDPYPVITDGRVTWVVDLYTSSGYFPYSKPVSPLDRGRLQRGTDIEPGLNYLSSSVKATIDAYDGTVTFYVVDDSDPLIAAWQATYPELFRSGSELPEALEEHLRYPQDIYRIQGEMYQTYHVDAPTEFFTGNDAWSIPDDPATPLRGLIPGAELLVGDANINGQLQYLQEMLPYYLLTSLPGESDLSYMLLQPFNPRDKPNMSSFMVADAPTGTDPGRMIDFRMPQGLLVGGTGQVGERIQQDDEISAQFTLWDQQGSGVIRGDILVVPIEESIMFVQPVYLQSAGGFPEFRRVVVVFDERIEWAPTLDEALSEVFGTEPPEETTPEPDGSDLSGTVQELLDRAADLLGQADAALREGDLGGYQRLVQEAAEQIEQARQAGEEGADAALEVPLG